MKTWVFLFLGCRVFLDGAEEFFILPTAWYYIDSFGETKAFLGFVLSAYSISAVFVGPIVGRLADRFGKIKCIATTCFALHVVGNLVYSMPISAYFPLMGRFISGMGNAVAGMFYGQIALYTKNIVPKFSFSLTECLLWVRFLVRLSAVFCFLTLIS